jgi:hypothetical protein
MRIRVFLDELALEYQSVPTQLWTDWLGFMLKLNPDLHFKYPQAYWNMGSGSWRSMGWHVPYDPLRTPPPLVDEGYRDLWRYCAQGGDLCLGMGTADQPTLWQHAQHDDPEAVRQGRVGYTQRLEPELSLHFGDKPHSHHLSREITVANWLSRNGLADRPCQDPRQQYHGEPLIARLISHNHLAVSKRITAHSQVHSFQILFD